MTPAQITQLRADLNAKFATLTDSARGRWASAAAGSDYLLSQLDPVGARACVAGLPISMAIIAAGQRETRAEFLAIFDAAMPFPTPPISTLV